MQPEVRLCACVWHQAIKILVLVGYLKYIRVWV